MKELCRRSLAHLFDVRVLIAVAGVLLSVFMHELFHVLVHWGDIHSVHLFPDAHAIVEITLASPAEHSLVVEEMFAYGITMVTLIFTAMLIGDVYDARDNRSTERIVERFLSPEEEGQWAQEYLAKLVGIGPAT